jgi:hypothetical protein
MADNIQITPGSGEVVATDEVDGRHFQAMKPAFGPDGTADYVSEDNPLPVHDAEAIDLISRMLLYLDSPRGYDKSIQRERVTAILESGTVTTVTTVATVTTLANIDGYNARMQILDQNRTSWAQCVRARIT